jgi:flagellar motility protein MotE (MotC chaperone)
MKKILIPAVIGLVSFAGFFAFGWLSVPDTASSPNIQSNGTSEVQQETVPKPPWLGLENPEAIEKVAESEKMAMTRSQLKSLIHDIREKTLEYSTKVQTLELRKQRLELVQNDLKADIEKLDKLREELSTLTAGLRSEHDKLLKTRVEIDNNEKSNLIAIAATYDKMDSASAGKILSSICASGSSQSHRVKNMDDAVKILYYMTERSKAKLLAEMVTSEPKLAAVLCQKLKRITEVN